MSVPAWADHRSYNLLYWIKAVRLGACARRPDGRRARPRPGRTTTSTSRTTMSDKSPLAEVIPAPASRPDSAKANWLTGLASASRGEPVGARHDRALDQQLVRPHHQLCSLAHAPADRGCCAVRRQPPDPHGKATQPSTVSPRHHISTHHGPPTPAPRPDTLLRHAEQLPSSATIRVRFVKYSRDRNKPSRILTPAVNCCSCCQRRTEVAFARPDVFRPAKYSPQPY